MAVNNSLANTKQTHPGQPAKTGITTFLNSMAVAANIDQALGKDNRQRFITVLQKAFPTLSGYHAVLDSGTHIIAYYDTSTMIPTDGNDINRIQVNLKIKSWKVNE